jgi:hypothetical protein
LVVVFLVLQAESQQKQDLILGSSYLGRQAEDMSTIGLFLQPLPIRVSTRSKTGGDLSDAPVAAFLHALQNSARYALSHAIGWVSLLRLLSTADDDSLRAAAAVESPNHPLFDAMVTFHECNTTGQASPLTHSVITGVEPLITWTRGAKFGIMFEFSAVKSSIYTLRVEYDDFIFSTDEVEIITSRINTAFEDLCQDTVMSMTTRDFEEKIRYPSNSVHDRSKLRVVKFGTRSNTLG